MFLYNAWYVAARSQELDGGLLGRTILNQPIVFFRGAGGAIAALEDRCCHRNAPLSVGRLKDGLVEWSDAHARAAHATNAVRMVVVLIRLIINGSRLMSPRATIQGDR